MSPNRSIHCFCALETGRIISAPAPPARHGAAHARRPLFCPGPTRLAAKRLKPFFSGGLIPPLRGDWQGLRLKLPLALWVLLLVALLAQRLKLTLACIWVNHAQSQVRPLPKMLDVMHDVPLAVAPRRLAVLALVLIQSEDFQPQRPPFWPRIKFIFMARRQQ